MSVKNIPAFLTAAVIVTASALTACTHPGAGYSEYADIPAAGWAYGDTVSFTPDSLAGAPLSIALRHNSSYPWRNLWLEVSDSLHRDTVAIAMSDSFGKWHGTGLGGSFQIAVAMPFAPTPGVRVNIRNIMRVDTLTGIMQVGLVPTE